VRFVPRLTLMRKIRERAAREHRTLSIMIELELGVDKD
jgi:hypothetical protein